jgi:hypothetical protein
MAAKPFLGIAKTRNYFIELPDLPTAQQTIEQIVNEPWTMDTLIE